MRYLDKQPTSAYVNVIFKSKYPSRGPPCSQSASLNPPRQPHFFTTFEPPPPPGPPLAHHRLHPERFLGFLPEAAVRREWRGKLQHRDRGGL